MACSVWHGGLDSNQRFAFMRRNCAGNTPVHQLNVISATFFRKIAMRRIDRGNDCFIAHGIPWRFSFMPHYAHGKKIPILSCNGHWLETTGNAASVSNIVFSRHGCRYRAQLANARLASRYWQHHQSLDCHPQINKCAPSINNMIVVRLIALIY